MCPALWAYWRHRHFDNRHRHFDNGSDLSFAWHEDHCWYYSVSWNEDEVESG